MTDLIHDFPINVVKRFKLDSKEVRLEGYEIDKAQLIALIEMFSRADYNVKYKERPSGPPYIVDLTSDQRNLVACNFDTEELVSGWYALKFITYTPIEEWLTHFPFRISLLYIGTLAGYQRWYALEDIGTITNDWSI